jgi:hypothetical protein
MPMQSFAQRCQLRTAEQTPQPRIDVPGHAGRWVIRVCESNTVLVIEDRESNKVLVIEDRESNKVLVIEDRESN